jgi:hypothetical protein
MDNVNSFFFKAVKCTEMRKACSFSPIFTCPENMGEHYFDVFRKCGHVGMWAWSIFTCSENVGMEYLHLSRNCERVVFHVSKKCGGSGHFTCPENVRE